MGSWACYMITWLYMEYRTRMEREGHTFKTHVIQWFEVLDGLLGRKWKYVGLAFNCVYLLFAAITQLIACGSNIFLLNNDLDKREWTYVFGAFGDNLHSLVPKLPSVFVLRRCGDHVHVVVYDSRCACLWSGAGSNPPWPQVFGSLLFRRHQHPLHLRQPGCHRARWKRARLRTVSSKLFNLKKLEIFPS